MGDQRRKREEEKIANGSAETANDSAATSLSRTANLNCSRCGSKVVRPRCAKRCWRGCELCARHAAWHCATSPTSHFGTTDSRDTRRTYARRARWESDSWRVAPFAKLDWSRRLRNSKCIVRAAASSRDASSDERTGTVSQLTKFASTSCADCYRACAVRNDSSISRWQRSSW